MTYGEYRKIRKQFTYRDRPDIKSFRDEFSSQFKRKHRCQYLRGEVDKIQKDCDDFLGRLEKLDDEDWVIEWLLEKFDWEKKQKKLKWYRYELETPKFEKKERITEMEIERAKEVDIVEAGIVEARRVGGRYKMLCPFHVENTPSLVIYPSGRGFYCFGCGVGGDTIKFVMDYNQMDFINAVKLLIGR